MSVEVMSGGGASPKLQTKTATPSTSSQSITPDSGYDGLSKVTVNAMASGSLNSPTISSSGLVTANVGTSGYISSGTSKTLQLSTQGSKTVTPGRYSQTAVSSGLYTTGTVTVSGDSNLTSANIASGVSIFGVTGTYTGESNYKVYYGSKTYSSTTSTFEISTDSDYLNESDILFLSIWNIEVPDDGYISLIVYDTENEPSSFGTMIAGGDAHTGWGHDYSLTTSSGKITVSYSSNEFDYNKYGYIVVAKV